LLPFLLSLLDCRVTIINGSTGDDTVLRGGGDDQLKGGAGIDTARGGTGFDVCFDAETVSRCEA
jgi:Ca2+-binding RTX toxin-like protein